jgi:hypothetical protein
MGVVVYTQGVDNMTTLALGQHGPQQLEVHLYVNDHAPQPNDSQAQYTDCTWPGYDSYRPFPSDWVGSSNNGVSYYQTPQITFLFDPSTEPQQTIYGYYVFGFPTVMYYGELFPVPYPIPPTGGNLSMILLWAMEQCGH